MRNAFILIICMLMLLISSLFSQDSLIVGIFYYSQSGHTRVMGEAVKRGAESVDSISVKLISVKDAKREDVLESDAIIVGSPVYNANVAPAVMKFINSWPFDGAPQKDKIGAAFVSAGGMSAGEEMVLFNILQAMLINGMIIVGGPDWKSAFGASAVTEEKPFKEASVNGQVELQFLEKAEALGRRVALLLRKIKE